MFSKTYLTITSIIVHLVDTSRVFTTIVRCTIVNIDLTEASLKNVRFALSVHVYAIYSSGVK